MEQKTGRNTVGNSHAFGVSIAPPLFEYPKVADGHIKKPRATKTNYLGCTESVEVTSLRNIVILLQWRRNHEKQCS